MELSVSSKGVTVQVKKIKMTFHLKIPAVKVFLSVSVCVNEAGVNLCFVLFF